MTCRRRLALIEAASLDELGPASLMVRSPRRQVSVGLSGRGLLRALESLAGPGATREELRQQVRRLDGAEAVALLESVLGELEEKGLLRHHLGPDAGPDWCSVEPTTATHPIDFERRPGGRLVLSRFALLRRHGRDLVLESPLSRWRFRLQEAFPAALVTSLARPREAERIVEETGLDPEPALTLLSALADAGLWVPADADERGSGWELHDLLFHTRCRRGWHDDPYGAADQGAGASGPTADEWKVLPPPAPADADDMPLSTALEARRSIRSPGNRAIHRRELEEFLHRTLAVRATAGSGARRAVRCVYPTAGGLGELSVHPIVRRCDGLDPGLYGYDPHARRLTRHGEMSGDLEGLLGAAARATAAAPPDVLLVVTARMGPVSARYRSVAYANVLKGVGGLYQTMYLVATAMGLAPCAVGGGDSALFARVSGVDGLDEPSVGEFILNVAARGSAGEGAAAERVEQVPAPG